MDTGTQPRSTQTTSGLVVLIGLLLAAPVVALMWVSSYAREDPRLWGIPFFYWYQFGWVILCAIATSIAYRLVLLLERRRRDQPAGDGSDDGGAR